MKKIIIVGAGGLGREVLQLVKDINAHTASFTIKGFIDDNANALHGKECSHDIIGSIESWVPAPDEVFVVAIANPKEKQMLAEKLKSRGAQFASLIHPTAIISAHTKLGMGLIVYPYARINVNCTVGDFVTLLSSPIGHDSIIGNYCTITTNCTITGDVSLGMRVFVGSGSTIIPHISIGDDAYIGAGSVVINHLKPGMKVMGNPARSFLPKT